MAWLEREDIVVREVLSVAALNRAVAASLARSFVLLRVRGEIANFTRAASGHWYFLLKDETAQVRCVMFRGRNALANFVPRDGDAVEVLAQATLYEARGEFQLNLEAIERAGAGRRFEEFLRLKARLAAEGLFDEARKRRLPRLPQAVGVLTSLHAAALRDVLTTLARRAPYLHVVVYPVPVQGAGAGEQIAAMLARASARREVEVLLLVRGGGSIEDLWAFNEDCVARAIRACPLPVVVGVGHESDFTIADLAADLRAPTPTAAAELVAPEAAALTARAADARSRLRRVLQDRVGQAGQRLDYSLRSLAAPSALRGLTARVAALRTGLAAGMAGRLHRDQRRFGLAVQVWVRQRPTPATAAARVQAQSTALGAALRARLAALRHRRERAAAALGHLDPLAVLARGYAVALDRAGRAVTDAAALAPGDTLRLLLARGAARARVEATEIPGAGEGN